MNDHPAQASDFLAFAALSAFILALLMVLP